FLVATRLVTVRTGFTPAGNSATMIPRASVLPSTISALPPSALKSFESVLWKGVSPMSAAGSHTRVGPEGFRISARVFTSKVRQPSDVAPSASRCPTFESVRPAEAAPAHRKRSRRFIEAPILIDIVSDDINVHRGSTRARGLFRRHRTPAPVLAHDVLHQPQSAILLRCEDGFGMELHRFHGQILMTNRHDDPVVGLGSHFQARWEGLAIGE